MKDSLDGFRYGQRVDTHGAAQANKPVTAVMDATLEAGLALDGPVVQTRERTATGSA